MTLSASTFPDSNWDGNEQDTANDGAADSTLAQAGDYNELSSEIIEIQRLLRGKVASAHGGGVIAAINKTGGALTCKKWVTLDGFDATTGLPKMVLGAATAAACVDGLGLLVMEKGGDVDTVADNGIGYVVQVGAVYGLDTSGFAAGDYLWPAASGALATTAVAGYLPVAKCDVSHATLGVLQVFPSRRQFATHLTLPEATNIAAGTSVGTQIGTTSLQKVAFFGATPVVRQAHIADVGSTVESLKAGLNAVLARLETLGFSKTS